MKKLLQKSLPQKIRLLAKVNLIVNSFFVVVIADNGIIGVIRDFFMLKGFTTFFGRIQSVIIGLIVLFIAVLGALIMYYVLLAVATFLERGEAAAEPPKQAPQQETIDSAHEK